MAINTGEYRVVLNRNNITHAAMKAADYQHAARVQSNSANLSGFGCL